MSWSKFCGRVLKSWGWTVDSGGAPEERCVILGVPHTSISDFIISYLYYTSVGHTAHIMIKKEFFKGIIGKLLRKAGCIPVDRSNGATVVRSVISEVNATEGEFHLCIAPEGTRKAVHHWKHGYHTLARALDCPVYMGYFDWGTKHIGRGEKFELTDDPKADTNRLQKCYEEKHYTAKHPEKYCTK